MSAAAPIRDAPVDPRGRTSSSYLMPDECCATCGCKTRGTMHLDCLRDAQGRLLVKAEECS